MRRARRGISSIFGFIVIFLLSMASIQTWSTAVSSMDQLQSASARSDQIVQMQGLERLSLALSGGDLNVTNDGRIPSTLEYLMVIGRNASRTVPLGVELQIGDTTSVAAPSGSTLEVVTSLGNVFVLTPANADSAIPSYWSGEGEDGGSGDSNLQLFQNPSDGSEFFIGSGSSVYAFGAAGNRLWSFNAGQGYVTDVMPLAGGYVYVSVGYAYPANTAQLYELSPAGSLLASFPVRLDQVLEEDLSLQAPVSKGVDADYALYDGWFYSADGPVSPVASDNFPLATADSSSFYFYQSYAEGSAGGSCVGAGNEVELASYNPGTGTEAPDWTEDFYLSTCGAYPPQLLAASAGGGIVAALFSAEAYGQAGQSQYPGQNPFLFVTSAGGAVIYEAEMANESYSSSIATDGTNVYLALPQWDQVQVVNTQDRTTVTYGLGFPAAQLVWAYGSLFAISENEVRVYGSGMNLERTISFGPLALASFCNAFPQEQSLHNPSFVPLNSTAYAAVLENSTGYATMTIGTYA